MTILTRADLLGRSYYSLADVLKNVPSINVEQDGSRGTRAVVKMRGGSAKRILVLIDGRPINHEFDGEVDFTQIPINIIERVEISRGGGSLAYGSESANGMIHIITMRPEEKGFLAELGVGVGRDGAKDTTGQLRGRSNLGDLTYLTGLNSSGGFSYNEDYEAQNHFGNISRSFNGKGYWSGEYYYQNSEVGRGKGTPIALENWNSGRERQPIDDYAQGRQEMQHVKGQLVSPPIWGSTASVSFAQSVRDAQEKPTPVDVPFKETENKTSVFQANWKKGGWMAGGESKELSGLRYPFEKRHAAQSGFYLIDTMSAESWVLQPALRYEHHSRAGDFLSPRLNLLFFPTERVELSATAEAAARFPNFDELFFSTITTPNGNLNPEKARVYDAGATFSPSENVRLALTYFHVRTRDLITPDSANRFANRGEEVNHGLETEFTLRGTNHWHRLSLRGHGTFQKSKRDVENGLGFKESPLTPENLVFFALDMRLPRGITLTNEFRHKAEQFELPGKQGTRLPAYTVWNIRTHIEVLTAHLYFDIENVLRKRYADAVSGGVLSPQPERTYWAGVNIAFKN